MECVVESVCEEGHGALRAHLLWPESPVLWGWLSQWEGSLQKTSRAGWCFLNGPLVVAHPWLCFPIWVDLDLIGHWSWFESWLDYLATLCLGASYLTSPSLCLWNASKWMEMFGSSYSLLSSHSEPSCLCPPSPPPLVPCVRSSPFLLGPSPCSVAGCPPAWRWTFHATESVYVFWSDLFLHLVLFPLIFACTGRVHKHIWRGFFSGFLTFPKEVPWMGF